MAKMKKIETIKYYSTCPDCGKEYQVAGVDVPDETLCHNCQTERSADAAKKELSSFIGAKVTCVEPVRHGDYTIADEIELIEIELADGKRVAFSVDEDEAPYIEWNIRT